MLKCVTRGCQRDTAGKGALLSTSVPSLCCSCPGCLWCSRVAHSSLSYTVPGLPSHFSCAPLASQPILSHCDLTVFQLVVLGLPNMNVLFSDWSHGVAPALASYYHPMVPTHGLAAQNSLQVLLCTTDHSVVTQSSILFKSLCSLIF